MKSRKVLLILAALTLLSLGAKLAADITMSDEDWIGLGAQGGRIVFDDQATDRVFVTDAVFGIGDDTPTYDLDILDTVGMAGARVNSTAGDAYMVLDSASGEDARMYWKEGGSSKWGLHYYSASDYLRLYSYGAGGSVTDFYDTGDVNLVPDGGNVGINDSTPSYKLDVNGNARVTGVVLADGRIQAGDGASDIDARADMPVAVAEDGQGGYFFYNADVSADTDLTGLYSTESNVERQAWVRWLVYDVTASTTHYGETVLEYAGGITSVVIADEGANDLLFKVARGADPNLVGYTCLDVVGNHSYEVVLMTMWH